MSDQDKHPLEGKPVPIYHFHLMLMKDYAFWRLPKSPTLESAEKVVTELTKHETSSPIFSPHITLILPYPQVHAPRGHCQASFRMR